MLARFGRIAMVAAVFSLIASGIVAIQYVMDGRPFDTRFFGACIFFAASIFALAAGYGLGDELRCALQRGGLRVAWPWLGIIAIMAGLFWDGPMKSAASTRWAAVSLIRLPPQDGQNPRRLQLKATKCS